MRRLIDSLMRGTVAPFAAVPGYLSRFGRAPEPARRALSPQAEEEIAAIRTWLADRGVRAWFEPGRKGPGPPCSGADRVMFEGRNVGAGCAGNSEGDELAAWRSVREMVDDIIHKRGNESDDAWGL